MLKKMGFKSPPPKKGILQQSQSQNDPGTGKKDGAAGGKEKKGAAAGKQSNSNAGKV